MIRTRCTNVNTSGVRCTKTFRARARHEFCRECYRIRHNTNREMPSRSLTANKYRRCKSRKRVSNIKTNVEATSKSKKNKG